MKIGSRWHGLTVIELVLVGVRSSCTGSIVLLVQEFFLHSTMLQPTEHKNNQHQQMRCDMERKAQGKFCATGASDGLEILWQLKPKHQCYRVMDPFPSQPCDYAWIPLARSGGANQREQNDGDAEWPHHKHEG